MSDFGRPTSQVAHRPTTHRSLSFEDVSVRYGTGASALTAVDGVDLTIAPGQIVGLVGESGSGKSTLAKAALGLAPCSSGRIRLGETDILSMRPRQRPVQMVFQDPFSSFNPRMSITESIQEAMPRSLYPTRAAREQEVGRLMELIDLDADKALLLPSQFSGGQLQRIAFARALASQPEVVLADEVTSALDVSVQATIMNLARETQRSLQFSMLFITHNLPLARYISDTLAVMYLGRIVETGPTEEVLADPQHPYTRELLASAPSRDTSLLAETPGAALPGEPPDPRSRPTGCHFHPRCPIGPSVKTERSICLTVDPRLDADHRPHHAACHFAGATSDEGQTL